MAHILTQIRRLITCHLVQIDCAILLSSIHPVKCYSMSESRHTHELVVLKRIAEALNREVDLQHALQTALENIATLFDLTTGWIFLVDENTGKFYAAATYGLPPALADHPRRMGGTCYCIDSYVDGDMDGAANINAIICTRLKDLREGTHGLRYHASIPLYAQDKPCGILNVASPDWREISDEDLRLLHTVGDLVSIAVERARLFRQSSDIGAINERNRLAREIHDTIAQGLAGIALHLETADALLDTDAKPDRIRNSIQKALGLTRVSIEEARRSVMDLRAAPLEGKTLPAAIRALLEDESLSATLKTQSEVMGSGPPLPVRIASGLYRIAQEAIQNVRKHAHATRLDVQLILQPERVRLIIEDDGKGFDPSTVRTGHFGLVGIHERVRLMNGKLDIASSPGHGTIIEVTIPLENTYD